MTHEKLKLACNISEEIKKLEKEIDFLLSYENRYYKLFKLTHKFKLEVNIGGGEYNPQCLLTIEDIQTLVRLRNENIKKLRKELEEL